MASIHQSSTHNGRRSSRTMLLRGPSTSSDLSSDDAVYPEDRTSTLLSIRSGSDQGEASAVSFTQQVSPYSTSGCIKRPPSSQDRRVPSQRRESFQNRSSPRIPTHYDNVDRTGIVQDRSTRSTPSSNDDHPVKTCFAKWKARCYFCTALGVCCLSVCASLLSIYTYVMASDLNENFCLPCSDLTQFPDIQGAFDYQLTTKIVDGQQLCCVNSSIGLSLLVAKIQQYEKIRYVTFQNMTSAHVGLYADMDDSKAHAIHEGARYTLHVSHEPSLQRCQNVMVENDRLCILIPGLYFVYSSIHYDLEEYDKTCNEMEHKTWVHTVNVYKFTSKATLPLLRSEHTCCDECENESTSGFTGRVFELHPGDQISVSVSAPPIVVDSKQTSYLGLFLMDNE